MKKTFLLILLLTSSFHAQWVKTANGLPDPGININCFTSHNGNLFMGTGGQGLFYSTNNGDTWVQRLTTNSVYCLLSDSNTLYAGALTGGLRKSTNNGLNWSSSSLNKTVRSIIKSGNSLFAATDLDWVYRSTNNGVNWIQTGNIGFPLRAIIEVSNIIIAGTNSNDIYLSSNSGLNWINVTLNSGFNGAHCFTYNGTALFAGGAGGILPGVFKSTNSGSNWISSGFDTANITSLASIGNNIFAGTYDDNGVFWVSGDNGINWHQRNEGLNVSELRALHIHNNYIFAGTWDSAVYRRPAGEIIGIKQTGSSLPVNFNLGQNYPNPFNPVTKLNFMLPKEGFTKLVIFDITGREVSIILDQRLEPGTYEIDWDATEYSSGIYFYTLQNGDFKETKKMILIK